MNEKSSPSGYRACPAFITGLELGLFVAGRAVGTLDVTEDDVVEFTEDGEYEPYDDVGEELKESVAADACSTKGTMY
jgi:hypothetical protein